jgi:DNA-binding NarL/FixJ family response regulator
MTIRVAIADDHAVVRQGLRTFLELQDDVEVVGEAADGEAAVELVAKTEPDVLLLDLVMPRVDGIEAIRRIRARCPATRILVLTSFADDHTVLPAVRAGAAGYLLKDVQPPELVAAIRTVHAGEALLDPAVQLRVIRALSRDVRAPRREPTLPDDLTPREAEVLRLIAQGLNNREIAERLFVTEATVKTHINNIFGKAGLRDRAQAVVYAIRHGLAEEP